MQMQQFGKQMQQLPEILSATRFYERRDTTKPWIQTNMLTKAYKSIFSACILPANYRRAIFVKVANIKSLY